MTETNRNTTPQNAATNADLKLERLTAFIAEAEQLQAAGLMPGNLAWRIESAIIEGREPSRMQSLCWDELLRQAAGA